MNLTIPNLLSILRMGLIPWFVISIMDGDATRGLAHATSGPCLQQNLVTVLEGEA